jgi:tetratricopeptide (TPR) repeat protein
LGKAALSAAVFLLCCNSAVLAAPKPPPNPLEITAPDPLLPQSAVNQPLSAQERLELKAALDELNTQATAQLQAGNATAAFEIWHRELRLRRALGTLDEVEALGRVGETAWRENQKAEVQLITGRLQSIKAEAKGKSPIDSALLVALGQAYQQVRSPEPALEVYQQILADARLRQDAATVQATLKTMAELQLAWFDYKAATATYEELLTLARAQGESADRVVYLQQLAYIYDKTKQPQYALKAKLEVAQSYESNQNVEQLPALKIAIASDYEALEQPNEARLEYQAAYELAISRQQFAYASEALGKLGALYRANNQPDTALQVYQVLLQVFEQTYNSYELMNTYDRIGQIYLELKDIDRSLEAFQKGLELAKSLQDRESYFTERIERVNQQRQQ